MVNSQRDRDRRDYGLDVRVARIEEQLGGLATQFEHLSHEFGQEIGALSRSISKIESALAGVGKMDGRSLLTIAASIIVPLGLLGSLFLSPLRSEIDAVRVKVKDVASDVGGDLSAVEQRLYQHSQQPAHRDSGIALAVLETRFDNLAREVDDLSAVRPPCPSSGGAGG